MLTRQENPTAARGRAQLAAFPGWEWSLDLDLDDYRVLPPASDPDPGDDLPLSARSPVGHHPT